MNSLILKNISKSFDDTKVLDDISLELKEGELLVLLGPSGCGKSTLLRLIAGLEELTNGEIYLQNNRIDLQSPKDRRISMVFQNYSLYPHMTVAKNLAFPLKIQKRPKEEIKRKVSEVAAMLGLSEKLYNRPGELSGGQRQRVALGRAIIRNPSIFLLDEPLSNLDADLRIRMRSEITRIQKELGTTMIHVTHDQSEALSMADRIALLNQGKIVQLGTPEELYRRPNSVFSAQFIGFPKMNILKSRIQDNRLIPFNLLVENEELLQKEQILSGIRPESIKISAGGEFQGVVTSCEYLGEQYIVKINYSEYELTISGCETELEIQKPISFSLDKSAIHFFDISTHQRILGEGKRG